MKGRLGVYDKQTFDLNDYSIDGVREQGRRLHQMGGNKQQERMIRDKRRSLDRALWHSYQGADIIKMGAADRKPARALINPNKLKQDYDDKIVSVGFEHGFQCGDVFEWQGTSTHWLIYLQDLTELAYFRGDIRKCSYQIAWEDEEGSHSTYVAVRGPVETKINFIQKHGVSIDTPNYTLSLLMPKTEAVIKYFKRYNKFYLKDDDTCWRVQTTDWISTPGILEVTAMEYFANETEDDIDNGIVGGLLEPIKNPNESNTEIIGDTFIKVKKSYSYVFSGDEIASWIVDESKPVIMTVDENNPKVVIIKWDSSYCGSFDLCYGNHNKTIVVESLF